MKNRTQFTIFVVATLIIVTIFLSFKSDVREKFVGKYVQPYTRPMHRKIHKMYPRLYKRVGSFLPF